MSTSTMERPKADESEPSPQEMRKLMKEAGLNSAYVYTYMRTQRGINEAMQRGLSEDEAKEEYAKSVGIDVQNIEKILDENSKTIGPIMRFVDSHENDPALQVWFDDQERQMNALQVKNKAESMEKQAKSSVEEIPEEVQERLNGLSIEYLRGILQFEAGSSAQGGIMNLDKSVLDYFKKRDARIQELVQGGLTEKEADMQLEKEEKTKDEWKEHPFVKAKEVLKDKAVLAFLKKKH